MCGVVVGASGGCLAAGVAHPVGGEPVQGFQLVDPAVLPRGARGMQLTPQLGGGAFGGLDGAVGFDPLLVGVSVSHRSGPEVIGALAHRGDGGHARGQVR